MMQDLGFKAARPDPNARPAGRATMVHEGGLAGDEQWCVHLFVEKACAHEDAAGGCSTPLPRLSFLSARGKASG